MCLSLTNGAFAKDGKYSKDVCKEIYSAVGILLAAADEAWKKKNQEDGARYAGTAANYATIYQVVCKQIADE